VTIGEKIKTYRKLKNLTQTDLGRICGTSKQTIFKYETGIITNIPLDKLELIADALDVSTSYLIGWEENEKPTVGEDDGLSDEKREAINEIYEALKNLSLEDLRAIDQVVAVISNRASPEQPRD
jgi:transcriptional regulator with XRE-family HTH domain